jgi:hypothetical protein
MRSGAVFRSRPAVLALACAAACVGAAGCSGDRDTGEGKRITAVVKRFALSSGPDACALLTPKALATVYGRGSLDPSVGRTRCVAASKKFSGQPVSVTFVKITDPTTAHATAHTTGAAGRYFSVALQKRRGRWLIDAVTPTQRPG